MGHVRNRPRMKLLLKYPSRGRTIRFFQGLDSIYNNIADKDNFHVSVTLDQDDPEMSNLNTVAEIMCYGNISVQSGFSKSKVDAFNRDMPDYKWDIIIAMSDDIRFTFYGFDEIIRNSFRDGLDWHVHYPDNDEKDKLPVLYVAGRDFYNRFGWIYNPVYKSLFCDTEQMEVAKILGRYKFEDIPGLFVHLLPAYNHLPPDQQWLDQQEIGWTVDKETYDKRKANNFYL